MPGVVRLGDLCSGHGTAQPRAALAGSPNVRVNGKAVVREGDVWALHGSPPHTGQVTDGAPHVRVNGKKLARIGDPIRAGCLSTCAQGSSDVRCGDK